MEELTVELHDKDIDKDIHKEKERDGSVLIDDATQLGLPVTQTNVRQPVDGALSLQLGQGKLQVAGEHSHLFTS